MVFDKGQIWGKSPIEARGQNSHYKRIEEGTKFEYVALMQL